MIQQYKINAELIPYSITDKCLHKVCDAGTTKALNFESKVTAAVITKAPTIKQHVYNDTVFRILYQYFSIFKKCDVSILKMHEMATLTGGSEKQKRTDNINGYNAEVKT